MRGSFDRRLEILESHLGQGAEAQLREQRAWAKARAKASLPQYHELLMAHCRGEISKEEYQRGRDELSLQMDERFPRPFPPIPDPEHERAVQFAERVFGKAVNEAANPNRKQRVWEAAEPVEQDEPESPEAPAAPVVSASPQSVVLAPLVPNGRRRTHPWAA